jgi:hypothetical protein
MHVRFASDELARASSDGRVSQPNAKHRSCSRKTGVLIESPKAQPPKSSNMTFSGSTPSCNAMLMTAVFIIGGPQM